VTKEIVGGGGGGGRIPNLIFFPACPSDKWGLGCRELHKCYVLLDTELASSTLVCSTVGWVSYRSAKAFCLTEDSQNKACLPGRILT